jgi:hypothetical protein
VEKQEIVSSVVAKCMAKCPRSKFTHLNDEDYEQLVQKMQQKMIQDIFHLMIVPADDLDSDTFACTFVPFGWKPLVRISDMPASSSPASAAATASSPASFTAPAATASSPASAPAAPSSQQQRVPAAKVIKGNFMSKEERGMRPAVRPVPPGFERPSKKPRRDPLDIVQERIDRLGE